MLIDRNWEVLKQQQTADKEKKKTNKEGEMLSLNSSSTEQECR